MMKINSVTATAFGAIGAVAFPALGGVALQYSHQEIGYGLLVSAAVSGIIGVIGYLSQSSPGAFQQVDLRQASLSKRK